MVFEGVALDCQSQRPLHCRGMPQYAGRQHASPGRSGPVTGVNRLLSAWTAFILLFFYLPIAILILFSFNQSRLNVVWTGFTTEWYAALWHDTTLVHSMQHSLIVATVTTAISVVLGTAGGWLLYRY